MGMGMVVLSGVSGPKRSIDQVSSLSLEVKMMSLTTLGSATIFARGKAVSNTPRPK